MVVVWRYDGRRSAQSEFESTYRRLKYSRIGAAKSWQQHTHNRT
jgi:hypothetical protein